MNKLLCITSTADGRLTAGKTYFGNVVTVYNRHVEKDEIRIAVFDNKGDWMTFDPKVFRMTESSRP